jgi:hypothetical protein
MEPPTTAKQFVQFDRGRTQTILLSFTESDIREWAECDPSGMKCVGLISAMFMTTTSSLPATAFLPQLLQQPLLFDLSVPSLVCITERNLPVNARLELHYYAVTDVFTVRILGVELKGDALRFQWTNTDQWTYTANAPEPVVTGPPFQVKAALRIGDGINTLRMDPPITPIVHGAIKRSSLSGIMVEVAYGFGFSITPDFGDTDQLVIVTAKTSQPSRLKRLATIQNGETTVYTNAKGFITDPRRVMDLAVACYQDTTIMVKWLLQALQMLDTPGLPYTAFIQRSCRMMLTGEAAKAFWLVLWRGSLSVDRMSMVGVEVVAEFA